MPKQLVKLAVCPDCGFQEQLGEKEHLKNFYPAPIDRIEIQIGSQKTKPIDVHSSLLCCKQCHRIAAIKIRAADRKRETDG